MGTLYSKGLTIVDTEADLPSAGNSSGIAIIKDTGKIIPTNGATWAKDNIFTTANIVADGTTDVGNDFRSLITKAKTVASATNRVLLKVTPGTYAISGQLDIGPFIDLDMEGAKLKFTTFVSGSLLTIGEAGNVSYQGTYKGINIYTSAVFYGASGHKYNDYAHVGVEFIDCIDCEVSIRRIQEFTTAVKVTARNFTAYNRFFISSLIGFKVGIQIHSDGPGLIAGGSGWVNENEFYGVNFQTTSNLSKFGSNYAIRYTSKAGGYTGHNQNVFFKPCFQQSAPIAISSGLSIQYLERYYNPTTRLEYKVTSNTASMTAGSTFPTHTSGTVADNNGINWEYVGPCRGAAVFHDGAGGRNRIIAARYEGGFGPFMIGRDVVTSSVAGARTTGNLYEVTQREAGTRWALSELDETCWNNSVSASAENELMTYNKNSKAFVTLDNLHKRAITSSAGTTVPGFEHSSNTGNTPDYYSTAIDILADGLQIKASNNSISLLLNTQATKRFAISYNTVRGNNAGRIRLRCLDIDKGFFVDLNTAPVARAWMSGASATANEISLPGPNSQKRYFAVHEDTKYTKVFFQGELTEQIWQPSTSYVINSSRVFVGGVYYLCNVSHTSSAAFATDISKWNVVSQITKTIISAITLCPINTVIQQNTSCLSDEIVEICNRKNIDFTKRYSYGTPLVGFFESAGEYIQNLNQSTGQPLGWYVTTEGVLAKSWAVSALYVIGSLVNNSGTIYRCITEHISSATFVTDAAYWVSIGSPAVLTQDIRPGFTPSILSSQVNSTTTVTGQSEQIGVGTTKLHVINMSTVNSSYVGLGTTLENAELACSTGTAGITKFILPPNTQAFINLYANTFFAWQNLAGTSTLQITQGV